MNDRCPNCGGALEIVARLPDVVAAFILMKVERPRLRSIADDLLAIDGIAEVYSVAGPYDLIAIVRVKKHEELTISLPNRSRRSMVSSAPRRSSPSVRSRRKT